MSFITKRISTTKFTTSKSDDEQSEGEDEQLFGVVLTTGQELIGYLPEPVQDNVLTMRKPLLGIKHFEPNISDSMMLLHPWSIVSDIEYFPINASHIVAVYPITKDIRMNHQMVWEKSIALLDDEPPQPQMVGTAGKISDDATLIIPQQRYPN